VELGAILLIGIYRKDPKNPPTAVGGIYNTSNVAFFVERI
jgi:hypothetical protein